MVLRYVGGEVRKLEGGGDVDIVPGRLAHLRKRPSKSRVPELWVSLHAV